VQEFDFVGCFKDIVISGEEGIVKPDPKIYQIAKERFGLKNGEALFVDDREENIRVAVQEGFLGTILRDQIYYMLP
jgi:2-haloacid dehalogenase